ncbi:MAG: hypothetical protein ACPLPS_06675, partial [bacterium]
RGMREPWLYKPNLTRQFFANRFRFFLQNAGKRFYKNMRILKVQKKGKNISFMSVLSGNLLGQLYMDLLIPSMNRAFEVRCLGDFSLEATATMLALKAYETEKEHLPSSLNELVPCYLPLQPLDPFDGEILRYSKKERVIYCVGKGLRDLGTPSREIIKHQFSESEWWRMPNPAFLIEF